MTSPIKQKKQPKRYYDVEMIRDFLDHLRWEYAILHFESTRKEGTINPELVEQLAKYQKKYNTVALRPATRLMCDDCSEEEYEQAGKFLHEISAQEADGVLEALTNLNNAFEIAFRAASPEVRNQFPIFERSARKVLKDQKEREL